MRKTETVSRALQLRGEIAARTIPLYIVGATVGLHPTTLGQMLLGRLPMPKGVADRIEATLARFQAKAIEAGKGQA
jgi:hypothetical protein